jgi:hypothetical protein
MVDTGARASVAKLDSGRAGSVREAVMCDNGDLLLKADGTRWKCLGGSWVQLPRSPRVPAPDPVAHFRVVDEIDEELLAAVADPRREVWVQVIRVDPADDEEERGEVEQPPSEDR